MKKTNRKGFTIVELVIVIAVIAILAAVLIPTFVGIIESANRAADTQLVANINTILAIEDVLGGGVNDAVEIQKVIKENGLKLETKVKGQYLWYDIDNNKVVLAGLNETGIAIDGAAPAAEDEMASKGRFIAATSPESFVNGYLFLSEESADGLAEAIHALRDPEGDNEADVTKSLNDALADLAKIAKNVNGGAQVAALMQDFMNQTAIMTEHGTVYVGEGSNNAVTKVLVSSGMKIITADTLKDLSTNFPELYIVDLPSTVVDIADVNGLITAGKIEDGKVNGIYFVYCNAEIEAIDKDAKYGGDIANLISVEQRGQAITTLEIVKVYLNKEANGASGKANVIFKTVQYKTGDEYLEGYYKHVVKYDFPALENEHNSDSVYEFKKYSFYGYDNPNSIKIGTSDYIINEDQQMLIKNGTLTVYAYYQELDADFKINGRCYSSAQVTSMLADPNVSKDTLGGNTITVISTTAKLDASLIGEESVELTIPSGVELLLPYKSDKTKNSAFNKNLGTASGSPKSESNPINYDEIDGQTKLTLSNNVTLNVAPNATIYIDAQCNTKSTPVQAYISDQCGVLEVDGTVVSNGNITAYGIIRGAGSITAESGTVAEVMTLYDWHGGTNSNGVVDKDIVPFHNWRADNIRVPLTLEYKTTYKMTSVVNVSIVGPQLINVEMAGPSNALFEMTDGDVIERSMSKNGNAKLTIVSGTVEDAAKSTKIYIKTVNFTKISMPLSHFDVEIKSGAALTLSNNIYMLMPGSSVTVDEGATLNINTQVLICNTYTPRVNVTDSSVAVPLPQYPDLDPAQLINNGTLNFNSDGNTKAAFAGEILSKRSGAKIDVKTGTVGELKIKDGFYKEGSGILGSLTGKVHYIEVADLYTMAFINDEQQTLSGSYTSTVTEIGDELYVTWN